MDPNLNPITESGAAPTERVIDAVSLNAIIKKINEADLGSAAARLNVQEMVDGKPPFNDAYLVASGQSGRCNLNFGDGKARIKARASSYYDLTDSVPTLAICLSEYGDDPSIRAYNSAVISEEFHKLIKGWRQFDTNYQMLIQEFCTHGVGFLYFKDEVDWRWEVAGLKDFKLPRGTSMSEDEVDIAVAFRDVPIGKLFHWVDSAGVDDTRWDRKTVFAAIMRASDSQVVYNDAGWERYQTMLKNNDIFASATAQDTVHLAFAWVREYSGRVSQYLTLRDGSNDKYLFRCANRFDGVDQCFTFFPFEVGTNCTIQGTRGLGHDIYATVQVLNSLRCQTVDNAKLSGSLLLQPAEATDAEDMAIMFYAGAAYIPPGLKVQNTQVQNPSSAVLPVIQEMSLTLRDNTGDVNSSISSASQSDKTKFEVKNDITKESVLPTAGMSLFYQPWKRHLTEVWRRVSDKSLRRTDPGAESVFEFIDCCKKRNVSIQAIRGVTCVEPVRAVGLGSPSNRLMAYDEFMQYYGSLDPVGQNNLLRARFAERVGYAQVDQFVPKIDVNGRGPVDVEIAELQNAAMSGMVVVTVRPNDMHIIHLQAHLPNIAMDLDSIESGSGDPNLVNVAQIKIQHISDHMKYLQPDKLQGNVVAELTRQFNNAAERVKAAVDFAQRQAAKQEAAQKAAAVQQQQQQGGAPVDPKTQATIQAHQVRMQIAQEDAAQKRSLTQQEADQKRAIKDAEAAQKLAQQQAAQRIFGK